MSEDTATVVRLDGHNEFIVDSDGGSGFQVGLGGDPECDNWGFVPVTRVQAQQMRDALSAALGE